MYETVNQQQKSKKDTQENKKKNDKEKIPENYHPIIKNPVNKLQRICDKK